MLGQTSDLYRKLRPSSILVPSQPLALPCPVSASCEQILPSPEMLPGSRQIPEISSLPSAYHLHSADAFLLGSLFLPQPQHILGLELQEVCGGLVSPGLSRPMMLASWDC